MARRAALGPSARSLLGLRRQPTAVEGHGVRRVDGPAAHPRGALPLLVVFEDAHWIDPTSRELLERYVEHARELRVLMMVTLRLGHEPPRIGRANLTSLTLGRLSRRQSGAVVECVAGDTAVTGWRGGPGPRSRGRGGVPLDPRS